MPEIVSTPTAASPAPRLWSAKTTATSASASTTAASNPILVRKLSSNLSDALTSLECNFDDNLREVYYTAQIYAYPRYGQVWVASHYRPETDAAAGEDSAVDEGKSEGMGVRA
ncbi:hypothetical protein IAT38_003920 [Cryptococcus sp. DSM 104549]